MRRIFIIMLGLVLVFSAGAVLSERRKNNLTPIKEDHHKNEKHIDHGDEKHEKHGDEKHDDHGDEKHEEHGNEKHDEHEENSKVGPDKGILKADKELGFILSPEAVKNFSIKTSILTGVKPWILPASARVFSQNEVNFFRIRNGYIKRIDFKTLSSQASLLKKDSVDLMNGDEVIIQGMGFVRIAELAAFGGAPEGHSH